MAALPYIQLYVADYLADTAHLTAAQHGAYLLLIMNYWQRGQYLNNSNERLANVARMSNDEWLENKPIISEFFHVDSDTWTHNRIEVDLAAVHAKSTKASNAGKASARLKRNERLTNVEQTFNHTDTDTEKELKALSGKPDESAPKTPRPKTISAETSEVISYLNEKAGTNFQIVEANTKLVAARLKEGATLDAMKRVIDFKVSEWGPDSKMREYLRPATLFNAEKFAQYTGQVSVMAQKPARGFVC